VQKIYAEMDIVSRAKRLGAALAATLEPLRAYPLVGDMRGVGFIVGLELMRDGPRSRSARVRAARRPTPAPRACATRGERTCMDRQYLFEKMFAAWAAFQLSRLKER